MKKGRAMKSVLVTIALCLLTTASHSDTLRTYLPSRYSLQVKTTGLVSISSLLQNTLISAKRMMDSKSGIRVSVGVSGGSGTERDISTSDGTTSETKGATDSISVSLHVTLLKYLISSRNLYIYYGVGPFGTYSYEKKSNPQSSQTWTDYSLGLDGCLGAEWFFAQHFAAFIEYNVFASAEQKRSNTQIPGSAIQTPYSYDVANYKLNYNSVFLGLSIYL
jgi:hypothetical protein